MLTYFPSRSLGGVVLVALSDSYETTNMVLPPILERLADPRGAILGDFLALISAVFYALYATLLKVRIHSESRIDMQLFFGFVGLYNICLCWVIGLFLHISGIEPFEMPNTTAAVGSLFFNVS